MRAKFLGFAALFASICALLSMQAIAQDLIDLNENNGHTEIGQGEASKDMGEPGIATGRVSRGEGVIVIASGRTYGLMSLISSSICDLINERRANQIRLNELRVIPPCFLKPGGSSEDNLASLRRGDVTLAMVQGDWQFHAFKATANYLEYPEFTSMRTVMAFTTKDLTLITAPSSRASEFFDIRRQSAGVGAVNSGIDKLFKIVGAVVGWGDRDYGALSYMSESEQLQALCNDEIGVGLFMIPHPSDALESTLVRCKLNMLNISKTVVNTLTLEVPYLTPVAIDNRYYSRLIQDNLSIGVPIRMVGLDSLDSAIAYDVYKLVMENLDTLRSLHSFLSQLDPETMAGLLGTLPIHPSVERYLGEKDINLQELMTQRLRDLGL